MYIIQFSFAEDLRPDSWFCLSSYPDKDKALEQLTKSRNSCDGSSWTANYRLIKGEVLDD